MRFMILKNVLELSKSINDFRQDMYELIRSKGVSDPDVIKISKQLDRKIFMLQKIIGEIRSLSTSPSQVSKIVDPVSITHLLFERNRSTQQSQIKRGSNSSV
ncbi:MAG: aspartyl-phosphate phosphatase Spo0E family protein [Bacillota bacterium]